MKNQLKVIAVGMVAALGLCGNLIAQDDNGGPPGPPPDDFGGPSMGASGFGAPGGPGNRGDGNGAGFNFDPEQFQQRMLERMRTGLAITNDEEWTAIQPLVQAVMDARRDANGGMGPGGFGPPPGNRPDRQQAEQIESVRTQRIAKGSGRWRVNRTDQ
jgi:hypothetical protein